MRRYELPIFLASIVVLNALYVAGISAGIIPEKGLWAIRFLVLVAALMTIVSVTRGPMAIMDLLRPMTVWRLPPWLYLMAAIWCAVIACITIAVQYGRTGLMPDSSSFKYELLLSPRMFIIIIFSAFVGEIVWIAYALRHLSTRYGYLAAAHLVGLVWTLWWLPMMTNNLSTVQDVPIGALLINQTGIAVLCATMYRRTGSGALILVMQVAFNISVIYFPIAPETGSNSTFWFFAIFYYLSALGLFFLMRGKFNYSLRASESL